MEKILTPHEQFLVSILTLTHVGSTAELISVIQALYSRGHKMPKYSFAGENSIQIREMVRGLQSRGILDVDLTVTPVGLEALGKEAKIPVSIAFYLKTLNESKF